MPIVFTIDHRARRVTAVVEGTLTLTDLERYVADRLAAGLYDYDQVIDVGASEVRVGPSEILATVLPNRLALRGGIIPLTALVASTPANLAAAGELAARFRAVRANVAIFETLDEARAWLTTQRAAGDA